MLHHVVYISFNARVTAVPRLGSGFWICCSNALRSSLLVTWAKLDLALLSGAGIRLVNPLAGLTSMSPSIDVLNQIEGTTIVVSSQWGIGNIEKFIRCASQAGHIIE